MKLYLLTRTDKWDYYNEYTSFVVAAENEESALDWHPEGEKRRNRADNYDSWTSKENLKIEHIGESNSLVEKVIISSFNAG